MSLQLALILLGISLVMAVFCGWRGARPPTLLAGPRLIPWRFLLLLFTFASIMLLAYSVKVGVSGG